MNNLKKDSLHTGNVSMAQDESFVSNRNSARSHRSSTKADNMPKMRL